MEYSSEVYIYRYTTECTHATSGAVSCRRSVGELVVYCNSKYYSKSIVERGGIGVIERKERMKWNARKVVGDR